MDGINYDLEIEKHSPSYLDPRDEARIALIESGLTEDEADRELDDNDFYNN